MTTGLSKSQWLLIMASGAVVLSLNTVGMWEQFLLYDLRQMKLPELYELYECGNPWLTIIPETIATAVLLLAIGWLSVHTSRRPFFQEMPLALRYVVELLLAILVGFTFMIISVSFSSVWVHDFWCGPLLGLVRSSFVINWSMALVLPVTSILFFWAMCLSNSRIAKAVVTA